MILGFISLLSTGCATQKSIYLDTTGGFAAASIKAAEAYRKQVLTLNTLKARAHLDQLKVNPHKKLDRVLLIQENSQTRLFTKKQLEWHIKLSVVLVKYSELIASISKKDLSTPFKESILSFTTQIEKLSDTAAEAKIPSAQQPLQKILQSLKIVDTIGDAIIAEKKAHAVKKAILDSSDHINSTLTILEGNQELLGKIQLITSDSQIVNAIDAYQRARAHLVTCDTSKDCSLKDSNQRINEAHKNLVTAFERRETIYSVTANLKALFIALRKAHKALVKVAREADDSTVRFVELSQATSLLLDRATIVLDTIEKLK